MGKLGDNQFERVDTDVFIKRAKAKHGNKFDYSKTVYVNYKTKVKIICPIHGEFEQNPRFHITSKFSCPKCAKMSHAKKFSNTKEEFVEKARKVHGDLYDYSKVKYVNARTPVTIICPIHGEFEQTPESHWNGRHCKRCSDQLLYKGWNEKHHFEPVVRNIFSDYEIECQFPVGKDNNSSYNYLVDFTIPELNLAIEYDEKHHSIDKQQQKRDKERQKYIEEVTGFHFIRVSDETFMKEGEKYFKKLLEDNKIALDR